MHHALVGPASGADGDVSPGPQRASAPAPCRACTSGQPWCGRGRPATAAEEHGFVARLTAVAADRVCAHFSRRDVTAVVNALRCGLSTDDLLRVAPGLVPGRLLAAYHEIDGHRRLAERAWAGIVAEPTVALFDANGPVAAQLVPAVVGRVATVERHAPAQLSSVIADAAAFVDQVSRLALLAEAVMAAAPPNRATRLGRALFDLEGEGLWHHEHFLAPRVGALVPTRLAALLGELRTTAA